MLLFGEKDAFWCEARGAQERSDGLPSTAMLQAEHKHKQAQAQAGELQRGGVRVPRLASNGDGSLRSDSNVI